jgi:hypothetical protein
MNANELADELENTYPFVGVMEIAAIMLRQQQAEIKKWTDQYQRLNENLEMWKAGHFKQQAEIEALKAHLVKEQDESFDRTASHMAGEYVSYQKELTDEEIRHIQAICHLKDVGYDGFIMRFARAILRKAQEK